MKPFKVVLADFHERNAPAWVANALEKEGIEFVAQHCATTAELVRLAADADVVWIWGSQIITAESLALLPECKGIIRTGSGTDNLPVPEATRRGIVVANTPLAHSDAVSNHAIGLLFAVLRRIVSLDRAVRSGEWDTRLTWPGWHLHGQTLGLVGFGHAARLVARKMRGFDLTLLAHDPYISDEQMASESVRAVSLDELLSGSDFVSLHCPLTPQTFHLIGERELQQMKPSAILINTARGAVINETALLKALVEGWIAAAGLDVLEQEPPSPDNPLFKLDNVVLTSHVAGQSDETLEACYRFSVEAAIALAHGRWPRSCVNRDMQPRLNLI